MTTSVHNTSYPTIYIESCDTAPINEINPGDVLNSGALTLEKLAGHVLVDSGTCISPTGHLLIGRLNNSPLDVGFYPDGRCKS